MEYFRNKGWKFWLGVGLATGLVLALAFAIVKPDPQWAVDRDRCSDAGRHGVAYTTDGTVDSVGCIVPAEDGEGQDTIRIF